MSEEDTCLSLHIHSVVGLACQSTGGRGEGGEGWWWWWKSIDSMIATTRVWDLVV